MVKLFNKSGFNTNSFNKFKSPYTTYILKYSTKNKIGHNDTTKGAINYQINVLNKANQQPSKYNIGFKDSNRQPSYYNVGLTEKQNHPSYYNIGFINTTSHPSLYSMGVTQIKNNYPTKFVIDILNKTNNFPVKYMLESLGVTKQIPTYYELGLDKGSKYPTKYIFGILNKITSLPTIYNLGISDKLSTYPTYYNIGLDKYNYHPTHYNIGHRTHNRMPAKYEILIPKDDIEFFDGWQGKALRLNNNSLYIENSIFNNEYTIKLKRRDLNSLEWTDVILRSDGEVYIDGFYNDSYDTSWITVGNGSLAISSEAFEIDELMIVPEIISSDKIKDWANGNLYHYANRIEKEIQNPTNINMEVI